MLSEHSWHRARRCQQGVCASGFHSDLGGHPALRAARAAPVRQGGSLGQEVFLRPLPAPSVCSFRFLSARRGAACAWPVSRQCHRAVLAAAAARSGRPRLRRWAHGSARGARAAAGPGLGPRLSSLALRRAWRSGAAAELLLCCSRCHGCSADGASPAAALTSFLPLLSAGTEGPSGSRRVPGISCAWGASLRGKSLAANSSERHRLAGASAWIETALMALSNISLWIRDTWAVGE